MQGLSLYFLNGLKDWIWFCSIEIISPFSISLIYLAPIISSAHVSEASETCALDIIGAKYIRDIENGEIISIEQNHIQSFKPFKKYNERPCIFERIYFASPDIIINGKTVYTYRKKLGEQLASCSPNFFL